MTESGQQQYLSNLLALVNGKVKKGRQKEGIVRAISKFAHRGDGFTPRFSLKSHNQESNRSKKSGHGLLQGMRQRSNSESIRDDSSNLKWMQMAAELQDIRSLGEHCTNARQLLPIIRHCAKAL